MNLTEHLLTTLAEEATEVAQACAKALRFGLEDGYPGTDRTNRGDIARELADMRGVIEMLAEQGVQFPEASDQTLVARKKLQVRKFLGYAFSRGSLTHNVELCGGPAQRLMRRDARGPSAPARG